MPDRISLFSEKGGVGKTTLSINLAAALAGLGRRVLVVDCDPQANATDVLLDGAAYPDGLDTAGVILGHTDAADALHPVAAFDGWVMPAGLCLADAQVELANAPGRDARLRAALETIEHRFDVVLFDCPPGRGLLAIAALAASDRVILPMDGSRHGLHGVQRGVELAAQVRKYCPDPMRPGTPTIGGIVLNRVGKNRTHAECAENLATAYGELLIGSIPAAVAVDSAGWAARPVVLSEPNSPPAKALVELARRLDTHGRISKAG